MRAKASRGVMREAAANDGGPRTEPADATQYYGMQRKLRGPVKRSKHEVTSHKNQCLGPEVSQSKQK